MYTNRSFFVSFTVVFHPPPDEIGWGRCAQWRCQLGGLKFVFAGGAGEEGRRGRRRRKKKKKKNLDAPPRQLGTELGTAALRDGLLGLTWTDRSRLSRLAWVAFQFVCSVGHRGESMRMSVGAARTHVCPALGAGVAHPWPSGIGNLSGRSAQWSVPAGLGCEPGGVSDMSGAARFSGSPWPAPPCASEHGRGCCASADRSLGFSFKDSSSDT